MPNLNMPAPEFRRGDKVASLVFHPPEIQPGTKATIVSPWAGPLVAVQLPNDELHRWFAWFELKVISSGCCGSGTPQPGSYAIVISNEGHPPHIQMGMTVKIVKVIPTIFYDLILESGNYHRWLAEFEIIPAALI